MDSIFDLLIVLLVIAWVVYKGIRDTRKSTTIPGEVSDYDDSEFEEEQEAEPVNPVITTVTPSTETSFRQKTFSAQKKKTERIKASQVQQGEIIDPEPKFDIQSVEEVRRAIIWSEILNRKY